MLATLTPPSSRQALAPSRVTSNTQVAAARVTGRAFICTSAGTHKLCQATCDVRRAKCCVRTCWASRATCYLRVLRAGATCAREDQAHAHVARGTSHVT